MGDTGIQWTQKTLNPVRAHYEGKRGWHCERVSQGCVHCYAEKQNTTAARGGTGLEYVRASRDKVTFELDEKTLLQPLRWRKPQMVFVCSMTDLFGEWVSDDEIAQVYGMMVASYWHVFQVLTKRPERRRALLNSVAFRLAVTEHAARFTNSLRGPDPAGGYPTKSYAATVRIAHWADGSVRNVWEGTSVEDQAAADSRIPVLLETPAAVRFLSCEPLLGPVDVREFLRCCDQCAMVSPDIKNRWVIVGGESGPGARPCDLKWIRSIVGQCQAAQAPVFVKQLGSGYVHDSEYPRGNGLPEFSMSRYSKRKNRKGGDPADWPEDIRVREMPR